MDHFALEEKEAFDHTRNIISTLNFQLPEEDEEETTSGRVEEPLYSSDELLGFAPREYSHSLDVKMVCIFTSCSEINARNKTDSSAQQCSADKLDHYLNEEEKKNLFHLKS